MIDAKNAVLIAKQRAADMLGQNLLALEEIERDTYKEREVWSITLSYPRAPETVPPLARISFNPLQYKRFLIDVEDGELVAIKLREPAHTS